MLSANSRVSATGDLIMAEAVAFALAEKVGKQDAHHLVESASRKAAAELKSLRAVLEKDSAVTAHLSPERIAQLFEPMTYQGVSQTMIERLLRSLGE